MNKEFILVSSSKESIEMQKNLFNQGYFWFYDDQGNPDFQLKSVKQYPIFIIKGNGNLLNWVPNEYLNKYESYKKLYRKFKLKRLNENGSIV